MSSGRVVLPPRVWVPWQTGCTALDARPLWASVSSSMKWGAGPHPASSQLLGFSSSCHVPFASGELSRTSRNFVSPLHNSARHRISMIMSQPSANAKCSRHHGSHYQIWPPSQREELLNCNYSPSNESQRAPVVGSWINSPPTPPVSVLGPQPAQRASHLTQEQLKLSPPAP